MPEAGSPAPPRAFVRSLLRSGTPAEPAEPPDENGDLSGVGSIAMWVGTSGLPAALWLFAGAVPLRAALTLAGGLPLGNQLALTRSIGCLVALAVAIVIAVTILILLGVGTRFAIDIGILRG